MRSLYSERRTWLHRVPAGVKLLLLAVLGTALFVIDRPAWLLGAGAFALGAFVSLGAAMRGALRLVIAVAIAGALIAGFHAFMGQPMIGAISAIRLVCVSLLGAMLTLTTRFDALLAVFETLLLPLERLGIRTRRLALGLGLMLRFTEHFFVQWHRLNDAHRARTGRSGGLRLLAPLTISMLLTSRRVADALAARQGS